MTFDKWFSKQSRLVQFILLILPVVGWIIEILTRLSVMLRTKKVEHIILFIIFLIAGWAWILGVIDLICVLVTGKQFMID